MSAAGELGKLYHRYAPRWFKVIRWREWGVRVVEHQKYSVYAIYAPALIFILTAEDELKYVYTLYHTRPQTDEERLEIKKNRFKIFGEFHRNWQLGQYPGTEMPPTYDMAERRKKYPEYYGDRYDNFVKTGKDALPKHQRSIWVRNGLWD